MNVARNLIIGTIAAVLVTALLIAVLLGENARMAKATDAQGGDSISRGSAFYDSYCAGCHGDRGQGLPGIYPPLNVEDMWTGREEIAFYGSLEDYVALNISAGHPSSNMPSWAQRYGGPLRDDQIVDLTNFVMNWQGPQPPEVRDPGAEYVRPTAVPEVTEPEVPEEPAGAGDAVNGQQVFVTNCSSCHGEDGAGGALGPSLITADVGAQDDDLLRETISTGRAGTAMPPWGGVLGAQDIEDAIAFLRSKQP